MFIFCTILVVADYAFCQLEEEVIQSVNTLLNRISHKSRYMETYALSQLNRAIYMERIFSPSSTFQGGHFHNKCRLLTHGVELFENTIYT